jgi:hypothetical protein
MSREVLVGQVDIRVLARVFYPWVAGQIGRQGPLLLKEPKPRVVGFDPVGEVGYLARFEAWGRSGILGVELATQTAEDLGQVEHVRKYLLVGGSIVDVASGEGLVELVRRGGNAEEVLAMEKIENGLVENGGVLVHFSPANEKLGYQFNCVDFWRVIDGEVVSVRLMVKNGEAEMRNIWKLINGGVGLRDDENLLANPVRSELKLARLFDMLELVGKKTDITFEQISKVVERVVENLKKRYGDRLFGDPELILRAYTMVHQFLENGGGTMGGMVGFVSEQLLAYYAVAPMGGVRQIRSYGCAGSSAVGSFASGEGWIIKNLGGRYVVQKGSTEGRTFCRDCGCWYEGSRCPLCPRGD